MVAEICDTDNRPQPMRAALAAGVRRLDDAGLDDPNRDARVLLRWATDLSAVEFGLALAEDRPLAPAATARFEHALARRAARAPVSHILGGRLFCERWFQVGPAVLDPRPESEILVRAALAHLQPIARPRVLDLGTGSGCLLLSVLAERPDATGLGADLSPAALEIARANAEALALAPRARFVESNWFDRIEGRWDAILCNPPYIDEAEWRTLAPEVRLHEPKAALTPGPDGDAPYAAIAAQLDGRLAPGARAFFEVGAGRAEPIAAMFRAHGFQVGAHFDLDDRPRTLSVARSDP